MALTLCDQIEALPAELRQWIFDMFMNSDDGVTIGPGYRPAKQLQINQENRRAYARHHYSKVTFLIYPISDNSEAIFPIHWLQVIPQEHRNCISEIYMDATAQYDLMYEVHERKHGRPLDESEWEDLEEVEREIMSKAVMTIMFGLEPLAEQRLSMSGCTIKLGKRSRRTIGVDGMCKREWENIMTSVVQ